MGPELHVRGPCGHAHGACPAPLLGRPDHGGGRELRGGLQLHPGADRRQASRGGVKPEDGAPQPLQRARHARPGGSARARGARAGGVRGTRGRGRPQPPPQSHLPGRLAQASPPHSPRRRRHGARAGGAGTAGSMAVEARPPSQPTTQLQQQQHPPKEAARGGVRGGRGGRITQLQNRPRPPHPHQQACAWRLRLRLPRRLARNSVCSEADRRVEPAGPERVQRRGVPPLPAPPPQHRPAAGDMRLGVRERAAGDAHRDGVHGQGLPRRGLAGQDVGADACSPREDGAAGCPGHALPP
mmetsp:Transcript_34477/g.81254  ORF Transcript_34477/g.81254 Transcript_34477/m.81254 type:complete len:298 (+) Transcript_34477:781-1674(+)